MAVTVYRSTDTSAPTLSGTAGDLVNLLDKCLVAGYGSKTAAGWSKPYTGTNAAVFRMGGGNQFYLDVNDNSPGAATSQEARLRGYEAMTAVATGTAPFPTVAQLAAGIIVRKSAAASGTTRVWTLIADDRTFYLLIQTGDTAGMWFCFAFGDLYSYLSTSDGYRTMIMGRNNESSALATGERADTTVGTIGGSGSSSGHYLARSYTALGASIAWGALGDDIKAGVAGVLRGTMALPHPVDGAIWLSPVFVTESTAVMRGKLRGFMQWLHTVASFADQDTVSGAGPYAGRTFLLFKTTGNSNAYCIDISGPWDTN